MNVAIIGAGMAGLSCAGALLDVGHKVDLFDKGSQPGGRMSTKHLVTAVGDADFDYGAQYMSARDPAFVAQVERWHDAGLVARWPAAGNDCWVGTPGMSAPVANMASRFAVNWSTRIEALAVVDRQWRLIKESLQGRTYDAVVVAVPAEQVAKFVGGHDSGMAAAASRTPSQPCWTLMVAFAETLSVEQDVIEDLGVVAWAARNTAKPGRSGPEAWVIQAGPEWSADRLEDDQGRIEADLLRAFRQLVGARLPEALTSAVHRWRYAKSGRCGGAHHLWNTDLRLGVCGDWLMGPGVEAAWLSDASLASAMVE